MNTTWPEAFEVPERFTPMGPRVRATVAPEIGFPRLFRTVTVRFAVGRLTVTFVVLPPVTVAGAFPLWPLFVAVTV